MILIIDCISQFSPNYSGKIKGQCFYKQILPYKILHIVTPIYSQELAIWMQNHWSHIGPSLPYIVSNKALCSQTICSFIMVIWRSESIDKHID